MLKRPKAAVDYSPGNKDDYCSICTNYSDGTCSYVEGDIDPNYWCTLFDKSVSTTQEQMTTMKLFIPLTKVDAKKRLVYGVASVEEPDKAKEIMDFETSVPYYKAWSEEISKASGGKSLGNVREMHSNIAAGKVTQLDYNFEKKQIEVCTECVDEGTWKKIEKGILVGFSHGGDYVKRWPDPAKPGYTRYTAKPAELSYVDNPCIAGATFEYIKADGTTEMRKFHVPDPEPPKDPTVVEAEQITAKAKELSKAAGKDPDEVISTQVVGLQKIDVLGWHGFIEDAKKALKAAAPTDTPSKEPTKEELEAAARDGVSQKWIAEDGTPFEKKADAVSHNVKKRAEKSASTAAQPLKDALAAVTAALDKKTKVVTLEDIQRLNEEEITKVAFTVCALDADAVKAYLQKSRPVLEALILEKIQEGPKGDSKPKQEQEPNAPSRVFKSFLKSWQTPRTMEKGVAVALTKDQQAGELRKHLYDVGRVASIVLDMDWLAESLELEAFREGDGSMSADMLKSVRDQLCRFLIMLTTEECEEIMEGVEDDAMEMAAGYQVHGLFKSLDRAFKGVKPTEKTQRLFNALKKAMEKVSAKHSVHIQAAHDHVTAVSGSCDMEKTNAHEKGQLHAAHNILTGMGASCDSSIADGDEGAEKAVGAGNLSKVGAENLELKKAISELVPQVTGLVKRIEELEAQPMPGKGVTRHVPRSADDLDAVTITGQKPEELVADVLGKMSADQRTLFLIKVAQRNPVLQIP